MFEFVRLFRIRCDHNPLLTGRVAGSGLTVASGIWLRAKAMNHFVHGQPNIRAFFMAVAADLQLPDGKWFRQKQMLQWSRKMITPKRQLFLSPEGDM